MINKLFDLYDIKYVISVDDCFAVQGLESLSLEIISEALLDFGKLEALFIEFGYSEDVATIKMLQDLNSDVTPTIQDLIKKLNEDQLIKCAEKLGLQSASIEKISLLKFLESLKNANIIEKYETISSTHEASNFQIEDHGMNHGAILWLIDRSFQNVGESETAGLELAKSKLKSNTGANNFLFMLTSIGTNTTDEEEQIEEQFNSVLYENDIQDVSFIYYVNKNSVVSGNNRSIARSLAYGFKRKQCATLIELYSRCLSDSCQCATSKLKEINQNVLNYLFSQKVENNGESYFDFFTRLMQIFHEGEYDRILAEKHEEMSKNIYIYQQLCKRITNDLGNDKIADAEKVIINVRNMELYDFHVNLMRSEIATGDIFKIDEAFYILITQSCDTCLRKDGTRKLDDAILLKIEEGQKKDVYKLSCFNNGERDYKEPIVIYQNHISMPFDLLDLCVANTDGECRISTYAFDENLTAFSFTDNYKNRHKKVREKLKSVYENRNVLDEYVRDPNQEGISAKIKYAYEMVLKENNEIISFKVEDNFMTFPIRRICRLNELTTIDLLNKYGTNLTRIGQPFDFLKR